jgi:hypothetical protein
VRDNVFETGPECRAAIAFARNGSQILVAGNVFKGARRSVRVDPGCAEGRNLRVHSPNWAS